MLRKSGSKTVSFCHVVRIFPTFSLQVLKKAVSLQPCCWVWRFKFNFDGGSCGSLFLYVKVMIDKAYIADKAESFLEGGSLFLVMVKVSSDNRIEVFIDGDEGVRIQDCIDLSRKLEACLDREQEDFELSVLSWGLGEPLKMKRQFEKNIGKNVEVVCADGRKLEGKLSEVKEKGFVIELEKGKGKNKTVEQLELKDEEVKTTKVLI